MEICWERKWKERVEEEGRTLDGRVTTQKNFFIMHLFFILLRPKTSLKTSRSPTKRSSDCGYLLLCRNYLARSLPLNYILNVDLTTLTLSFLQSNFQSNMFWVSFFCTAWDIIKSRNVYSFRVFSCIIAQQSQSMRVAKKGK